MALNPSTAANIAHNATRYGAIQQAQSPITAAPQGAAFPGSPLTAGPAPAAFGAQLAAPPVAAGAFPGAQFGVPQAAFAPFAGVPFNAGYPGAAYPAAALGPAAYAPAAAYPGAYPGALHHPTVVAPTYTGAVAAAGPYSSALVPAVGAHLVDDWSAAHGYGYPATYGYGALPATSVALGGVAAANLYDARLVGTAAANPALYAASYGAPFGGYAAPSYVPAAVSGVPTFSALNGLAGTNVAAANVAAAQGLTAAYAPNYFNSAALNTFNPAYFGGFAAGQFGGIPAAYY